MSCELPFFSCVIPVKGERPFIKDALASLDAQGIGDELEIIVQDGDVDSRVERADRAEEVGDVRWFREEDLGQSDALNKGFAKAKGEWLFWLNADDVLLPGALKKVRELIGRAERVDRVDWIAGDTVYIDAQGKVKEVRCDAKWRPWFGKKLSVWTGGPSAFFRRALWEKHGGFDTDLKYVMDIELWTRWAKAGEKFAALGDYVWGFREHGGSKTGSGANRDAQLDECARVDARHGVSSGGFWRNVTRAASVLDGSWSKRCADGRRLKGMLWG